MGKKSVAKRTRRSAKPFGGKGSQPTAVSVADNKRLFGDVPKEIWLFGGLFMLVAIRFAGVFSSSQPLPNWDAPGHFFALERMADYLSRGQMHGYLHEWLGGIELFRFYPPLFYVLTVGFWWLGLKLLPLAMAFRLMTFLSLLAPPVGIWYLTRSLAGRSAGYWAIVLSAAYIFYPQTYSAFGIGAGSSLWIGLIPNSLGLGLGLFWVGLLERLRQHPYSRGYLAASALVGAALALTHTLSAAFAVLLVLFWGLINIRQWLRMGPVFLSGLLSLALSAFWVLPFVRTMGLSSGTERGAVSTASYFFALLPVTTPFLEAGAGIVFAAALAGSWILIRQKNLSLAALWFGALAFFLIRIPLAGIMPAVGIHYYRFLAVLFALELAVGAVALDWLWRKWAEGERRRQAYLAILGLLVVGSFFNAYDVPGREQVAAGNYRSHLAWESADFSRDAEGQELIAMLAGRGDAVRSYVELPLLQGLVDFGSVSYFSARVPDQPGHKSMFGLFVESAPQTPFFMPLLDAFRPDSPVWGDERLYLMRPFVEQGSDLQLDRLKVFGVNYVAGYSERFKKALADYPSAELVGQTDAFDLYRLDGARGLITALPYRPAIYLTKYGGPSFRDLGQVAFAGADSYDLPIVESDWSLERLADEGRGRFGAVVVQADHLNESEIGALSRFSGKAITLAASPEVSKALEGSDRWSNIERLEIVPKGNRNIIQDWPEGWVAMAQALADSKQANAGSETALVEVTRFDNERIEFLANRPAAINAGWAPGWRSTDGRPVWRVTPDQMMVLPDDHQPVRLVYGSTKTERIGQAISLLGLIGLMAAVMVKKRRPEEGTA